MTLRALLFALSLALGSSSVAAAKSPKRLIERKLIQRDITITDENAHEVQVLRAAPGVPVTLTFSQPLKGDVILADTAGAFVAPQQGEATVLLVPVKELSARTITTLTATIADGTPLVFRLVGDRKEADVRVHVDVQLQQRAGSESPATLRALNAALRSELDECTSLAADAGVEKVAALVMAQDFRKPAAFAVERVKTRKLDKQSRLLVEVKALYRLFEHSYVVLTVKNRDPSKTWVLDRPLIEAKGGSATTEVPVVAYSTEFPQLSPDEEQKVVVAFVTPPAQGAGTRFTVRLTEKGGSRHVAMTGLSF